MNTGSKRLCLKTIVLVALCTLHQRGACQWLVADTSGTVVVTDVARYGPNGYIGISSDLYVSEDAGATWEVRHPTINGFPTIGVWKDAHFPSNVGYMAGAFELNNQYAINRSADGGSTWQNVSFSNAGAWPRRYNDMHFPSTNIGYAGGTGGKMVKTTNGGTSWTDLNNSINADINSIHFFNDLTGIIIGGGFVMRTTNGGSSWASTLNVSSDLVGSAAGSHTVVAGNGALYVSINGGVTWTTHAAPFDLPRSVHVFDTQRYIVLDGSLNKVFSTTDGGASWVELILPIPGNLEELVFLDEQHGCIVGQTGNRSMILVTNTGPGEGLPVATFSHTQATGCGWTDVTIQLSSISPDWNITWYRGGVQVGSGPQVTLQFNTSTYQPEVEAHISNGTHTSVLPWTVPVQVTSPFIVNAGDNAFICSGANTQLSVSAPPGSTINWTPATGLSSTTIANPTVSGLTEAQLYTVTVVNGPCTGSDQVLVDLEPYFSGSTWLPIATGSMWGRFSFVDEFNGFYGVPNIIYSTSDGGLSWTPHPVPLANDIEASSLRMVDPFRGYATRGTYELYQTDDGWNTYSIVSGLLGGNNVKRPYPKRIGDRDTIIIVCGNVSINISDRIMVTFDGGNSWQLSDDPVYRVADVVFVNDSVVVAAGGTGLASARVYRSTDAGISWTHITSADTLDRISALELAPDGTLYAVSYGNVLRSFDQGLTWEQHFHGTGPTTQNYGFISFLDQDTGFTVLGASLYQTVNAGACWQLMTPNTATYNSHIQSVRNKITVMTASNTILGERTLFRDRPVLPGVQFSIAGDTICQGTSILVVNNSIGQTSFEWFLDGVFLSSEASPSIPPLPPGDHVLVLEGTTGSVTTQHTRTFHVQEFNVTPTLALTQEPCWAGYPVEITASSPTSVLSYQWFRQASSDTLQLNAGGPTLEVMAVASAYTYYAVPISLSGCPGNWSEPLVISANNAIPTVFTPSGPGSVCTWGGPASTWYGTSPAGGATDITGYVWSLLPPAAGTIYPDGDSCLVSWDPEFTGIASVRCQGVDACGAGTPSTRQVTVDQGAQITLQPQDLFVDLGDTFTLEVELSPAIGGPMAWYFNGSVLVNGTTSYTSPPATIGMSGEYYWRGQVSATCGHISSDTITVTVLPPTGIHSVMENAVLRVYPNPSDGIFQVQLPGKMGRTTLMVSDAFGRIVKEFQVPEHSQPQFELDLTNGAPGHYTLHAISPIGHLRTPLIKVQ